MPEGEERRVGGGEDAQGGDKGIGEEPEVACIFYLSHALNSFYA